MRLGIDLGTTRTIVAHVDRGNYPLHTFDDLDGDPHGHLPSVTALSAGRLVHGFEAVQAARAGAPVLRSVKRLLGDPGTHPGTTVTLGDAEVPLLDVLVGYLGAVRAQLPAGDHQVAVAVPAHAHSVQRFMTLEAFRRAGFEVLAMVNEPSAAGFEYSHRQGRTLNSRRTRIVVYDLGGGTFDVSLVESDGTRHTVLDSVGVNRLGGDDLDQLLTDLALEAAGRTSDDLGPQHLDAVREQCREAKEALTPQTRKIVVDVPTGGPGTDGAESDDSTTVVLPVADFYAAARPLLERTIETMAPLVGDLDEDSRIAGIYLVGGGCGLPAVPRMVRERFGRRVHRSPYPAGSTAIGLAIAADPDSSYTLTDRLSRGFGVFRERDHGRGVALDPVFTPEVRLPGHGTVTATRRYRAAHDLGWFRFVEYTATDDDGAPHGDLAPSGQVLFPFDPALQAAGALDGVDPATVTVRRTEDGPLVEETYTLDAEGIVSVRITDLDTGHSRQYGPRARG
ncbi:Hsp70 family protein [Brevibacterium litoralis]|uniref:Hsp70 family protein n=1 Tax=Brevibacterium litoralis TaxID=3138935 RepID=UPI0032EF01CD